MFVATNIGSMTPVLIAVVFFFSHITFNDAACKGSVTFYWKESPVERESTGRNWGVLEKDKTIMKSTSQLAKVIDTNNTYALRLEGDCCWELFNEKFFKGDSYKLKAKLPSGFAGIDGFPQFKALSVKKSNPKGKPKTC